ncbi:MAG: Ni/Fe-hydrogenase, b-type cytochrome subunit [Deltaproteobacteria bacterium]|nr:Ni/Fe-hydrogenase, b-type cytochrome subunit [Deltaproteobacteria bacterium]
MDGKSRRLVYVWEWPVRFFHWTNFLCMLGLTLTGFIIGNPPALQSSAEASFSYWFGWVRFIHFSLAYLFLCNLVFRVYWALVGNAFARWNNFIPIRRQEWVEIWHAFKRYLILIPMPRVRTTGHNRLAGLSYLIVGLLMVLQVATGFGMYAAMSESWFPRLFAWIVPLFGGDMVVRQWHHLVMWVFILFTGVHVYLAYFNDNQEQEGLFSSIITGFKFVERDRS